MIIIVIVIIIVISIIVIVIIIIVIIVVIITIRYLSNTFIFYVYRPSQVRKPIGSEVKRAECSLIIGTGCWVQAL